MGNALLAQIKKKLQLTRVGLYIGVDELAVSEVQRDYTGLHLLRSKVRSYSANSRDMILAEKPLRTEIKEILQESGIHTKKVSLSLPAQEAFLRYFEMPPLPAKERVKAARFEVRKHTRFPYQELELGVSLEPNKKKRNLSVAFVGAKRKVLEHILKEVEAAGLEVDCVEPVYLSILRAFLARDKRFTKGTWMFLSIDRNEELYTLIHKDGFPLVARHSTITEQTGQGVIRAESYMAEIQFALDYFAKSFSDQKIQKVIVYTPDQHNRVADVITQDLNMPAERLDLLEGIAGPGKTEAIATRPMGAALSGLVFMKKIAISLIKVKPQKIFFEVPDLPPAKEKVFLAKCAVGEFAVLAVILAFVSAFTWGDLKSTEKKYIQAHKANMHMDSNRGKMQLNELKDREKAILKRIEDMKGLLETNVTLTDKMSVIAELLPANVWLRSLVFSQTKHHTVVITGHVRARDLNESSQIVNQFVNKLSQNEVFMKGLEAVKVGHVRNQSEISESYEAEFEIRGIALKGKG